MLILIAEAVTVYLIVLLVHSLRHRVGLGPFYATLGGLTVIMSWVTDIGIRLEVGGLTFLVGSTVFYTAILLGVFVVYVFDGPGPTRTAIFTVAGMSILAPLVGAALQVQLLALGQDASTFILHPSLRINTASVFATIADLVFLAVVWELLGRPGFPFRTWIRTYLTLLGVMCLDVVLFSTGAFAGTPAYLSIMSGTLATRVIVATFAGPLLYGYLAWQNSAKGAEIESRPALAIFMEVAQVRESLRVAEQEIERRIAAEQELEAHKNHLEELVAERTRDLVEANIGLEEANEAKRIFLANMSHELRTPLNSVIGFSGTLGNGMAGPLNEEQQRQVDMVNNSGRYLLSLIDDVLDIAKIEAGETVFHLKAFDPDALVREAVEMMRPLAKERGLEISVESLGRGEKLRSDPAKVKHVLLNLLSNAIKFTVTGRVVVRCERPGDGSLVLSVQDTGPGIEPADLSRVFDAFTQIEIPGTAKSKGTGLGLALSRVYAEMLGGEVTVSSEVGVGSVFTLTVPGKGMSHTSD